jgi:DNA-binding response OmpR family regulator
MKILVIDDDQTIAQTLKILFATCNYAVDVAVSGEEGWQMAAMFEYDLIVLDIGLPDQDGIYLCQRFRSQGYQLPILLLTGRDGGHQKAIGLNTGADDYVVKPFHPEELIARVQALLRRSGSVTYQGLEWGQLRLEPNSRSVTYSGHLLTLTPKEYAILELFLRDNHRVLSPRAILDHAWAFDEAPGEETIRAHIKGLRQKLKAVGAPADFIETVYRVGYRLKPLKNISSKPEATELTASYSESFANETSIVSRLEAQVSKNRQDSHPPKVIAISQDAHLLKRVQRLLESKSLQVVASSNAHELWSILEAGSPSLVILDAEMPDVNSLEFCRNLRHDSYWKKSPIIILIPHTNTALVNQVIASGADDFVFKPIADLELVSRVMSRLNRSKLLQATH